MTNSNVTVRSDDIHMQLSLGNNTPHCFSTDKIFFTNKQDVVVNNNLPCNGHYVVFKKVLRTMLLPLIEPFDIDIYDFVLTPSDNNRLN